MIKKGQKLLVKKQDKIFFAELVKYVENPPKTSMHTAFDYVQVNIAGEIIDVDLDYVIYFILESGELVKHLEDKWK